MEKKRWVHWCPENILTHPITMKSVAPQANQPAHSRGLVPSISETVFAKPKMEDPPNINNGQFNQKNNDAPATPEDFTRGFH